MKRALILSAHFPPDSSAAAHRVRLLAPHLPRFDWEPTVLTVASDAYEAQLDPQLTAMVPPSVRVVRAPAWRASTTRRVGFGDIGLRSFTGMWRTAARLASGERFDVLFVTIYPAYTALLGPLLQRRFGMPFILDYQDPWVGSWGLTVGGRDDGGPDVRSRASRRIAAVLEPIVVRHAAALTSVSAATCDQVIERNPALAGVPVATLPLGWDVADLSSADPGRPGNRWFSPTDGNIHFCSVGTLLPNAVETLRVFLTAVKRLTSEHPDGRKVRLHFFGTSNQTTVGIRSRVQPVAAELGMADIISEVPERIPYLEAIRVLRDADVVLMLGSSERHYTASKLFSAIIARRPVLALFHEASSVCDVLGRLGSPPAVRLVTFDDQGPARAAASLGRHLWCAASTRVAVPDFDLTAVHDVSAQEIARRLAALFDRVTASAGVPARSHAAH